MRRQDGETLGCQSTKTFEGFVAHHDSHLLAQCLLDMDSKTLTGDLFYHHSWSQNPKIIGNEDGSKMSVIKIMSSDE